MCMNIYENKAAEVQNLEAHTKRILEDDLGFGLLDLFDWGFDVGVSYVHAVAENRSTHKNSGSPTSRQRATGS